jgi:hypothetical protein
MPANNKQAAAIKAGCDQPNNQQARKPTSQTVNPFHQTINDSASIEDVDE